MQLSTDEEAEWKRQLLKQFSSTVSLAVVAKAYILTQEDYKEKVCLFEVGVGNHIERLEILEGLC